MKFSALIIIACFCLCSCSGVALQYTPVNTSDGARGYNLFTVYGGLDGNKQSASAALDREAKRLCAGDFLTVKEEEHDRLTAWGAKNGQIDYLREIRCK